jgi:hypothetical protein
VKIGRNDPCWCGSGVKYKNCHLERESQQPLPQGAIFDKSFKRWKHTTCLHPNASKANCGKIIDAHSIQRSSSLKEIIDEHNEVKGFTLDSIGNFIIRSIGWRKASTFTGFCNIHDSEIFRPIETEEFIGSPEQCFLLAYRSLCREIYQKTASLRTTPDLRAVVDRGAPAEIQQEIQRTISIFDEGSKVGLDELKSIKSRMDSDLFAKNYSNWNRVTIFFNGPLCITTTAVFQPDRDFDSNMLQVLHDLDTPIESLFVSIIATSTGGAISFSWRVGDLIPLKYMRSLLNRGDRLLDAIVQWAFFYSENTFFSKAWWDSLSIVAKSHIRSLASEANPYYAKSSFLSLKFAPWELDNIKIEIQE